MELIIGLIVFVAVVFIIIRKKDDQPATTQLAVEVKAEAPYKVETPAPVVVEGAGAVDLPATPVVGEVAVPAKAPRKPRAPKAEAVAKKPAAKKAAPKKAAAIKAKPTATKSKKA